MLTTRSDSPRQSFVVVDGWVPMGKNPGYIDFGSEMVHSSAVVVAASMMTAAVVASTVAVVAVEPAWADRIVVEDTTVAVEQSVVPVAEVEGGERSQAMVPMGFGSPAPGFAD